MNKKFLFGLLVGFILTGTLLLQQPLLEATKTASANTCLSWVFNVKTYTWSCHFNSNSQVIRRNRSSRNLYLNFYLTLNILFITL